MKLCSVTALGAGQWEYRVYEAPDHSAASGISKNQRSSQGNLLLLADARMRRSASLLGACSPDSHLDTVPCDTRASSAISDWVTPNTHLRMWVSGLMRRPYSKTNCSSTTRGGGGGEETNTVVRYSFSMSDQVIEIISELLEIAKIDQKKFAKVAGVSQSTVSKWRNGTHQPSKPAWDKVMIYAAGRPATAHLVHRYIFSLLDKNEASLGALVSAAFNRRAS